ncbi:DUF1851 domain-containing protein [Duganella sp. FT80W]|uniref:DUF1851 domain-containing protein n=1 Tax=Duganella guangzhouensis TaxID=2666084 RepID=A0A6I2L279_9BURK|nr:T6SS immunity protein Tdi1 domain-containing protein [Duganella guangzhouensis]MRW92278.1 DUF1851 domain-containing protein [Duganella guangzhouensis]
MTLDDLTVNFAHLKRETLLEDWAWLVGPRKLPILLTASGDAFIQDTDSGAIEILDVASGTTAPVAESLAELQSLLADRDFVGDYFAVQLVGDLRLNGLILKPGQIYSFIKPPLLGGEFVLENVDVADIEVHFSLSGQIARQVLGLPAGGTMCGVKEAETAKAKPRWKFWQ